MYRSKVIVFIQNLRISKYFFTPTQMTTMIVKFLILFSSANCLSQNPPNSSSSFLSSLWNGRIISELLHPSKFLKISPENVTLLQYFPTGQIKIINSSATMNLMDPTKIIIHGWTSHGELEWVQDMASRLHQVGTYNVFAVDWSEDAGRNYLYAATATKSIGYIIGDFIARCNISNVHIIAHSLGAHIAGFAGKRFHKLTAKMLDRISALDPAAPLFETSSILKRVDRDDAKFVDVFHTQIGIRGIISSIGNMDCYINGGIIQPKCFSASTRNDSSFVSCGHSMAHYYYRQSISYPQKYKARLCSNIFKFYLGWCKGDPTATVGYWAKPSSEGVYYMSIGSNGDVVTS